MAILSVVEQEEESPDYQFELERARELGFAFDFVRRSARRPTGRIQGLKVQTSIERRPESTWLVLIVLEGEVDAQLEHPSRRARPSSPSLSHPSLPHCTRPTFIFPLIEISNELAVKVITIPALHPLIYNQTQSLANSSPYPPSLKQPPWKR